MGAESSKLSLNDQVKLAITYPNIPFDTNHVVTAEVPLLHKVHAIKDTNAFKNSRPDQFHVVFTDQSCRVLHLEQSTKADSKHVMMVNMDAIEYDPMQQN